MQPDLCLTPRAETRISGASGWKRSLGLLSNPLRTMYDAVLSLNNNQARSIPSTEEEMAAEIKDLVAMYFERENAMQTLWQIYVGIVIGLLAFVGAVPSSLKKIYFPIVLSVGFIGFAVVNGDAIHDIVNTRNMLWTIIHNAQGSSTEEKELVKLVNAIQPPTTCSTTLFCIGADACVLIALWGFVWLQRRPREVTTYARCGNTIVKSPRGESEN
jgi:hypothetical protein